MMPIITRSVYNCKSCIESIQGSNLLSWKNQKLDRIVQLPALSIGEGYPLKYNNMGAGLICHCAESGRIA